MSQVYKLTLGYQQSTLGASESYFTPPVSGSGIVSAVQKLIDMRRMFLFSNQFFTGLRVAQYPAVRGSVFLRPGTPDVPGFKTAINFPGQGAIDNNLSVLSPTIFRDSLQVRLDLANGRSKFRYHAGPPMQAMGTDPTTFFLAAAGKWGDAFSAFWNWYQTSAWQILAQNTDPALSTNKVRAIYVQTAGPSNIGISVDTATAPAFVQGGRIHLTGFRPAKGTRAPTVNGYWTVDSLNNTLVSGQTIVYLRNSATIDPTTIRWTDKSAITIHAQALTSLTWWDEVAMVSHKRGRPFGGYRGRALTRLSLDP